MDKKHMRRDAPRREHSEKPRISTEKPRINTENKYQDEPEGLIVGRNPVLEALKSGKSIDVIYTSPNATGSIASITRIAREQGIVVKSVSDAKLSQMCGGQVHQGVIASGACAEYVSVEEILEVSVRKGTSPFIIICDEIEDPHNLGAIIRTAEAAGADGVIIPKRRSASLNATVYKTSAGAASYLPVARVANISQTIDMLKSRGVWIYGTDAAGESYTRTDLTGAVAFVIGNEGSGMGKLIRGKCDHLVSLPMNGRVNSLNASVAAGIFMYETVRQRMSAGV